MAFDSRRTGRHCHSTSGDETLLHSETRPEHSLSQGDGLGVPGSLPEGGGLEVGRSGGSKSGSMLGTMAHIYNPSFWEAEAKEWRVQVTDSLGDPVSKKKKK
jgi:hypothetical protein